MSQEWIGVGDMVISDMNVHILKRVCVDFIHKCIQQSGLPLPKY